MCLVIAARARVFSLMYSHIPFGILFLKAAVMGESEERGGAGGARRHHVTHKYKI